MQADVPCSIPGVTIRKIKRLNDARGWFEKLLMREHVSGNADLAFGEIYVSTSVAGAVRGNHVHDVTFEWFIPLSGRGTMALGTRDLAQTQVIPLDGDDPICVFVPPNVAHAFWSEGAVPMLLLAYSDRPYDPAATDTTPLALAARVGAPGTAT